MLPEGAEPAAAGSIPEYTPRNPPDFQKPALLCSRVFNVSIGCNVRSTVVPAAAPDYEENFH